MIDRGLVDAARVRECFERIKPQLYRYPAIDPDGFERAVEDALGDCRSG
jgi:hypothetical protein